MFSCDYCARSFKREQSLATHKCVPQQRLAELNQPALRIAFQAYQIIFSERKTAADFITSSYYKPLQKFGHYCCDIKAIAADEYTKWLWLNKHKLTDWTSDRVYTQYLCYYLPREPASQALTRAKNYATLWAQTANACERDFLRWGTLTSLTQAICSGKLTGWIVYASQGGQEFLTKLTNNSQLLGMCWPYIDTEQWQQVFNKQQTEYQQLCNELNQLGW